MKGWGVGGGGGAGWRWGLAKEGKKCVFKFPVFGFLFVLCNGIFNF